MSPETYGTEGTKRSPSSSANEPEIRRRGHEGYVPNRDEQFGDHAPTFVLDVPVLNVDEIDLEVNDLRAHVALRAELANLVNINVGVDVYLNEVKLDIKGVEAQALLKISLDRVLGTLDRALGAIDKNPQILGGIAQDVDPAVGDARRDVSRSARETEQDMESIPRLEDAAGQASEATKQTGDADERATNENVQRDVDESGSATETLPDESNKTEGDDEGATSTLAALQIEEEYIDERGQIVGRARDESGNVVEEVLNEEGDAQDLSVSEDEVDDEVEATDAARRKANELGVKLSGVRGTGSGGRVLVKDVERAEEQSRADSA